MCTPTSLLALPEITLDGALTWASPKDQARAGRCCSALLTASRRCLGLIESIRLGSRSYTHVMQSLAGFGASEAFRLQSLSGFTGWASKQTPS